MGKYDDPLGSILIGSWVCVMLYSVVLREGWYYFKHFRRDSLMLKLFVGAVILIDSASLLADCADVYLNTITHWGDVAFIQKQYWPVTLYLATTGVTAALVQSFLAVRYYTLTRNWILVVLCFAFILLACATAEATAIIFAIYSDYTDRYKGKIPVIIWMTTTTVADIGISVALITQLYTMKTSFSQTESMIKRLIRQSIQTGSATSLVAVLTLITFLINNSSNIETMFAFILGRVYVLTLLANVNMRKGSNKDEINMNTDEQGRTARVNPTVTIDGIQVHRTIVRMDDDFHEANPTTLSYKSAAKMSPTSDSESIQKADLESV